MVPSRSPALGPQTVLESIACAFCKGEIRRGVQGFVYILPLFQGGGSTGLPNVYGIPLYTYI